MEVDILTPQMHLRTVSGSMSGNKRARSPGSPGPIERERPLKRSMVLQRDFASQFASSSTASSSTSLFNIREGNPKRYSLYEEEWVHQTQGMTIHSPALSISEGDHLSRSGDDEGFASSVPNSNSNSNSEDGRGDDVQMDGTEEPTQETFQHQQQGFSTPPQEEDSTMRSPTASQQSDLPLHSHPHSHSQTLDHSSTALNTLNTLLEASGPQPHRTSGAPKITLHPATPSTPSDGPRLAYAHALAMSQPATPPPISGTGETHLGSSPRSSLIVGASTAEQSASIQAQAQQVQWRNVGAKKRPFVSMGPRADCEKCRLKVPGHWMHFD